MKLVTYEVEKKQCLGIFNGDSSYIFPLKSLGMDYRTMEEAIAGMCESEKQLLNYTAGKDPWEVSGAARRDEVRILAPILQPARDVICLGLNYRKHAEESARYKHEEFSGEIPDAVYFSKRVNRSTGDGETIPSHSDMTEKLDYEVELAVILGRDACRITEEEAEEYIFGYTIINDVSARDVQMRHRQWFLGKSLDGFLPMGPCIVSADEIGYPPKLAIRSYVNGQLRQNSNTENLIFDIGYVLRELSAGMTLKAGTIIALGTPDGVGMGFDPPRFLKPGDEVVCEIEGIGRLTNRVE